jgi:acyl-CoA synthetase (AMP-forming)/AMP-acid ligase II
MSGFEDIGRRIARHARSAPTRPALRQDDRTLTYAELDTRMDAVAAALHRDGLQRGDAVAIGAATSIEAMVAFLGALRAGLVVAPLAPGTTPPALQRMLADAEARWLFTDASVAWGDGGPPRIALDGSAAGTAWNAWLGDMRAAPRAADLGPDAPFNIIYSSGTTGEPKGIVQSHGMRNAYAERAQRFGYGPDTVTLQSTPLYSNTTLVVVLPTLHFGGCVVLMRRFDAAEWLRLAAQHRVTHAMLVPVQYERLLAHPDFDRTDLSHQRFKFSTSAPFPAATKAEVLRRWPGALVEFYGSTEGGGSCILEAHRHPDKLHTVGRPAPGHDIRLIDEAGREVPAGQAGEVVGRSPSMMQGYHRQRQATRDVEWFDAEGRRFLRSGDIGRFDADGFLTLIDRRKDVLISGGFNVYPSDLEAVLRQHPDVAEAAVVGVPSARWGETPVGFVVRRAHAAGDDEALRQWANERLGSVQRLHAVRTLDALPRSAIGKVLKRALRERWHGASDGD